MKDFDLATDSTMEAEVLEKMSADLAYQKCIKKEFYAKTGTCVWTPNSHKGNE